MVPLLGGIIGGTVDGFTTNTIGNIAKKIFIDGSNHNSSGKDAPIIIDMK